jgi:hypothetical protein
MAMLLISAGSENRRVKAELTPIRHGFRRSVASRG